MRLPTKGKSAKNCQEKNKVVYTEKNSRAKISRNIKRQNTNERGIKKIS